MKRVKLKHPLTPPGGGEPTKHVLADWVIRHEDRYEIRFGDEEWHLDTKNVASLTDTEAPFTAVEPDVDHRTDGESGTHVACPICGHHFTLGPDFDTGEVTCRECHGVFYGHLHTRGES